jgi:rhodanese-related sulfurtransferase
MLAFNHNRSAASPPADETHRADAARAARRGDMQTIDRDELKRMNETDHEDFVLINVLPREAFNEQHIRTSINIPVDSDDFADRVEAVAGGKHRKIVVYCANFDCDASPKAAEKLEAAGFEQVYDYAGGTEDWFAHKHGE